MSTMNRLSRHLRARRNARELQRAINGASTPSMREELLSIAARIDR